LIDHKGVIRNKWLGFPGEERFDSAVDRLLELAENDKAKPETSAK
jgi:hypothetical protein